MQENIGITIDQVLDKFLTVTQEVYTEAESLGLTFEAIEIAVVPIERRLFVRIKEFQKNSTVSHQKGCDLRMREVQFDEHVRSATPSGASLRFMDRSLTPEGIERVLAQSVPLIQEGGTEI